ncbi:hypothetical protein L7F22_021679 [Adiantum nelumboides]|nr:hypothetical protein [Adiantum nelumboides]
MGVQVFFFTIIIAMASNYATLTSCSSSMRSFCTLQLHYGLQSNFALQSLFKPSQYPFLTPLGEIFLTQDLSDCSGRSSPTLCSVGRITFNQTLHVKDESNQLLSFGTSSTKYNDSGDGIAFVVTTDNKPPPNSTGGFLGLMPEKPPKRHQQSMALEFDTYQNLQVEIADPRASHIGIDIFSLASVKPVLNAADPSHPLYLYRNSNITAWLSYNASTPLIQVWAANSSRHKHPAFPILRIVQNLSQVFENHTIIYVGITAPSGNNSQATILYSWNFTIEREWNSTASPHLALPWIAIIVVVSAIVLLVIIFAACGVHRKIPKKPKAEVPGNLSDSVFVTQYGYHRLRRASKNFSLESMIGRGAFSIVYKGVLEDGTVVAIKRISGHNILVGAEVFAHEMRIISKVKHKNLLKLKGWCYERGEAMLVFKYMPKGSLQDYLFRGNRSRPQDLLDSEARFKIILDVATGLQHLHHGVLASGFILHRDVKPANVLLTDKMEAKLGDFGLACLIRHDQIVTCSTAVGTVGYIAPELLQSGQVTKKVDVYSFGVLALVVACGRMPLDVGSSTCSSLVEWVQFQNQNASILDALDPILMELATSPNAPAHGGANIGDWRCVLHLSLLCCQEDPTMRPGMTEVLQTLENRIVLLIPKFYRFYPSLSAVVSPALSLRIDTELLAAASTQDSLEFLSVPCHFGSQA